MISRTLILTVSILAAAPVAASQDCALCARSVVTTKDLAACFMAKYGSAVPKGSAVAIDLTGCGAGKRSVVPALPAPAKGLAKPDTRFIVSPAQLDCLRRRLADPALDLDPQARIDLESCE